MKKAFCYYRKSIERESEKSIQGQRAAVHRYALENNIEIVAEFQEVASSMTTDREQLNQLFEHLKTNQDIDYLLVHRFDRMTRDMQGIGFVLETLRRNGKTRLHSVTENNNYEDDPFELFKIMMLTFGATIELQNISKRMQEGKKKKQEEGGFLGGRAPIGYRTMNGTGSLEVEEEEVPIVKEVFELREKGLSMQKIADKLNEKGYVTRKNKKFHPPAVQRILRYRDWYEGKAQAPSIF